MRSQRFRSYLQLGLVGAFLVALALVVSCGNNSTQPQNQAATVNTSISDPPTCTNTIDHIFVTVTKVTAHISPDAGPNDSGWVTLVDLTSAPKQLDLPNLASTACILTQLGSTTGLPVGTYQQIRLILLDNNPPSGAATPSPNNCGSAGFNCVVPKGGSPQTLALSSESQTGIKIPASQIADGGLTVKAGQAVDLNIDFDSCASIVQEGNGTYRLKPVLHAGEVATNNNAISGKVVDSVSGNGISGAIVLLEQPDSSSNNIDRVKFAGMSAGDGTFIFCPLPSGNFDVVVAAEVGTAPATNTYNTTVALNVPVGTALNNIPLVSEGAVSSPATISGTLPGGGITSTDSTGGVVADVTLLALQAVTGSTATAVTVPVFGATSQPPVVTTGPSAGAVTCPPNTDCANYSLSVPASNPSVGVFSGGSITYGTPASGTVSYTLKGEDSACTTVTPANGSISSIAVTPGNSTAVSTVLAFTGCTAPI